MAKILELVAKLSADKSGFDKAMKGASDSASRLKTALAGAFAGISMTAAIKSTVEYADRIMDLSQQFQIIPEQLQEMQYWATQNAASVDDLSGAFENLNKSRKAALEGDTQKLAAFERMGIKRENLSGIGQREAFQSINQAAMARGQMQSSGDIREIFGKSASKMSAAFQADLNEAGRAARDFGAIIDNKTVASLSALNDQASAVAMVLKTVLARAVLSLSDAFIAAYGTIKGITGTFLTNKDVEQRVSKDPAILRDSIIWRTLTKWQIDSEKKAKGETPKTMSENIQDIISGMLSSRDAQVKSALDAIQAGGKAEIGNEKPVFPNFNASKKSGTKSTIDSDAFAKIGGFVGGGGALNYQRETSDGIRSMVRLFQGPGGFIRIKDQGT